MVIGRLLSGQLVIVYMFRVGQWPLPLTWHIRQLLIYWL